MRTGTRATALLSTLAVCAGLGTATAAPAAAAGPVAHFVVLGEEGEPLGRTTESVRAAGGEVLRSWPQISVVVATSPDPGFAAEVRGLPGVVGAGATRNLAELSEPRPATRQQPIPVSTMDAPVRAAGGGEEPLAPYQWALRQIRADRAHVISQGSRDVLVGVLDSGIHPDNPDLAPNLDTANSVSCANQGRPDTSPEAWTAPPGFAHGTAVSGIIAGARNGVGVSGVAPNVRIAMVKMSGDDGLIYPENAICGYIWAAEHGMDVTNASFFVDPWARWCDDDPDQAASAEAVLRAIEYAADHDVVNVAGIGNFNWDMSHPVLDTVSPINGEPIERLTGNDCALLPAEARGVLTVSGVGAMKRKTTYSSYGIRDTDVTAPAGGRFQIPNTPDGEPGIITTFDSDDWGYFGGTSAASPHAAGVVALIRSTHPDWPAKRVLAALERDANRLPCPPGGVYDPGGAGQWLAHCQGGRSGWGFYGSGLIDALAAVTR